MKILSDQIFFLKWHPILHPGDTWVAQDVECFASISDKKMITRVIVKVSLQCCCGEILSVPPCHRYYCELF